MKFLLSTSLALLIASTSFVRAADLDERIHDAINIVEKRQGSDDPIPTEILQNAKGIAICTIIKGGIGIGGQGGEGVIVIRHLGGPAPVWRAPSAFNISGASLGAQFGFSSISYIIVLNTERAIGQFVGQGKMKWDATATGTAGPDTGVESQSTRELEKHDVLGLSRFRRPFWRRYLGRKLHRSEERNQPHGLRPRRQCPQHPRRPGYPSPERPAPLRSPRRQAVRKIGS